MDRIKDSEADSTFFLKIVLYLILGSVWVVIPWISMPLPIGLAFGVLYASHDHFQIDRRLEYVVLLIASIISFAAPVGIVIGAP